MLRVVLPYAMVIVATLIVAEASLSSLGLGVQAPTPPWGNMIAGAQNVLQQNPGCDNSGNRIVHTVVAFNHEARAHGSAWTRRARCSDERNRPQRCPARVRYGSGKP